MDAMSNMFASIWEWLTHPFTKDMPLPKLALTVVLFIILAFVLYDGIRILKSWMENAAEAVS